MQSVELLKGIPLFGGLAPHEIDGMLAIFRRVTFDPGASVVRQGHPADSAFILESGTADVLTALPGGGAATVASLGPGSMLGEMALLECGVRSATVLARTPVAGFWIERDSFRVLLAQRSPAVFAVQRRITLALCQRLRELNAKIVAHGAREELPEAFAEQDAAPARRGECSFDCGAFLPLLPFFRGFGAEDIESFTARTQALELARGAALFRQEDAGTACWVVVRGAVELSMSANGGPHRIGVLGPGRLCGVLALVEDRNHSATAVARENTALLELGRAAFMEIHNDHTRLAGRFHDAINRELLQALARTNNHLTRLISQARIRARYGAHTGVEELQRALSVQDCRAAEQ